MSYAYKGATFVKKNFCLVARIFSFDTVAMHVFRDRTLSMQKGVPEGFCRDHEIFQAYIDGS